MKTMLSLRRHHYADRVSIFLIMMALTAGMVGCVQSVHSYDLTIASTNGGSVTIPGEGTSTYDEGTVVNLTATPDPGYRFVNWTGNVSTIGNVDNATTTIVVNDVYSITADFAKQQYSLTATSTGGGSITLPGEDMFVYDAGTVVNLVAKAEIGYKFVAWTGDVHTIKDLDASQTTITMNGSYSIAASFKRKYAPMVAGGAFHTVGLKTDGTAVAAGYREYGESDVGSWTDIVQVAAGKWDTLGLRANGTLISGGWNDYGQLNVGGWTDITQVATSFCHTVGLKFDGTVIAVGDDTYGKLNVGDWTDIIQVAAGSDHTVGLKSNGTVVAVGGNWAGQCNVGAWTGIIQVAAGYDNTVGLKADGTVVAVGRNNNGQLNVGGWTDIVQVLAGEWHTVGLKSDGTVVAVGWNQYEQCNVGNWTDVIQVGGSFWHTVGVKSNGTVVAVGENGWGQCDVGGWDLS